MFFSLVRTTHNDKKFVSDLIAHMGRQHMNANLVGMDGIAHPSDTSILAHIETIVLNGRSWTGVNGRLQPYLSV